MVRAPAKVNPNISPYSDDAASKRFDDALFMVAVGPKDDENVESVLPTLDAVMPSGSVTLADARGGLAATRPSRVQLLTKDRVSIALDSPTLPAEAVVDAFASRRDAHMDDPRARADALRHFLESIHRAGHVFTLALFDESARAFAAWTPRSAPLSFGHADDGTVVVVAARPGAKTLVGRRGAVELAHLPAGRFVYGHSYLKPFEFTSLWASAKANRSGSAPRAVDGSPELEKPKFSPEDGRRWRWEKTGSRAEQASFWRKKEPAAVEASATFPAETKKATFPAETKPGMKTLAPERVTSKTLAPERVSSKTLAPERITSKTLAQERVSSSPADLASAAANRLTFAIGVAAHFAFRPGLARVNRYDTSPPKRFLTLLALRLAVFADATTTNGERRVAMFDAMEACLSNERGEPAVGVCRVGSVMAPAALSLSRMIRSSIGRGKSATDARRAAEKTRNRVAAVGRVKTAVGSRGGSGSSVITCDLNGRCCIGNHCFIV